MRGNEFLKKLLSIMEDTGVELQGLSYDGYEYITINELEVILSLKEKDTTIYTGNNIKYIVSKDKTLQKVMSLLLEAEGSKREVVHLKYDKPMSVEDMRYKGSMEDLLTYHKEIYAITPEALSTGGLYIPQGTVIKHIENDLWTTSQGHKFNFPQGIGELELVKGEDYKRIKELFNSSSNNGDLLRADIVNHSPKPEYLIAKEDLTTLFGKVLVEKGTVVKKIDDYYVDTQGRSYKGQNKVVFDELNYSGTINNLFNFYFLDTGELFKL